MIDNHHFHTALVFVLVFSLMHLVGAFIAWDFWWWTSMPRWQQDGRAMYLMLFTFIPGCAAAITYLTLRETRR